MTTNASSTRWSALLMFSTDAVRSPVVKAETFSYCHVRPACARRTTEDRLPCPRNWSPSQPRALLIARARHIFSHLTIADLFAVTLLSYLFRPSGTLQRKGERQVCRHFFLILTMCYCNTSESWHMSHTVQRVKIKIEARVLRLRPGILWQLTIWQLLDLLRHWLITPNRLHGATNNEYLFRSNDRERYRKLREPA